MEDTQGVALVLDSGSALSAGSCWPRGFLQGKAKGTETAWEAKVNTRRECELMVSGRLREKPGETEAA